MIAPGGEVLLLDGAHVGPGQDGGRVRTLGHVLVHDDDSGLSELSLGGSLGVL